MNAAKQALQRAVANGRAIDWDVIAPVRPTMPTFSVFNARTSFVLGQYAAPTAKQAIELACIDAGYQSLAHAEEVTGRSGELAAARVADYPELPGPPDMQDVDDLCERLNT